MMNQVFRDALYGITRRKATVSEKLMCGGMAGLVGQWVTYPLDTIRRRMQVSAVMETQDSSSETARLHARGSGQQSSARPSSSALRPSMTATLSHLVRTEGFLALFKGFSVNWVKGPISSGIRFTMVELVDTLLSPPPAPARVGR